MPGRGATPKADSVTRHQPLRGWHPTTEIGWQCGDVPEAPEGLEPASVEAWTVWFEAWFASHWTPDDLPGLRQVIRLYNQVELGEYRLHSELRIAMDTYGLTPKGQQDRRWAPPGTPENKRLAAHEPDRTSHYAHLRTA